MAEDGDLCLGFLLSVDAQDYDDAEDRAKPGAQPGRRRRTGRSGRPASRNFGADQTVIWRLVNQDGWKIADIGPAPANGLVALGT